MKKFFISALSALAIIMAMPAQAETNDSTTYTMVDATTFKSKAKTRKASQPIATPYYWEDAKGEKHPIFMTKNGACFVYKTSKKTGKEYRYYLPKDIRTEINKLMSNENL